MLLIAVVLVPSFALLLAFVSRERAMRLNVAQSAAFQLVDAGVAGQREAVDDGVRLLRAFAMLPQIRTGNSVDCQRLMSTLRTLVEEARSLTRTRASGIQDCATVGPERLPRDVSSDAQFQDMRDKTEPTIGRYVSSAQDGELLLPLNLPLRDSAGVFDGVLSAGLRMPWLASILRSLAETPGAVLSISTADGVLLRQVPEPSASDRPFTEHPLLVAMQQNSRGVLDAEGTDGQRRVWAYDQLSAADDAPVFLSIGLPARAVYSGVNREVRLTAMLLVVWLALLVGLAWWATERFVLRDVRALLAATERVGAGDLSVRTGRPGGDDELGRLAGSFDAMAARLEEREARVAQAQKLESIGQLAGGVAHDFNNLLTAIIGNAELARQALAPVHPARSDIDATLEAAHRSAALTQQLLTFARHVELSPRIVEVADLLRGISTLLQRVIGEQVTLRVRSALTHGLARLDTSAVEQVIVNLIVNARDAMPAGGTIELTARNLTVERGTEPHRQGVAEGEWIVISVRDTGTGMSPEVLEHAFEPFFTTKPVGRGTGLGLATVYGTVRQHDGHVTVHSALDVGTTVSLYLRPAEQDQQAATEVEAPASTPVHRDANVLLVEDEPAVRRVVSRLLLNAGYAVREASDGKAALELLEHHALDEFDLVVTDVVMPHLSGPALVEELRAGRPTLPVLFMSGYREPEPLDEALAKPHTHFLAKPFTSATLLEAVRHTLSGERSDPLSAPSAKS